MKRSTRVIRIETQEEFDAVKNDLLRWYPVYAVNEQFYIIGILKDDVLQRSA